jgi:hypothetical protein
MCHFKELKTYIIQNSKIRFLIRFDPCEASGAAVPRADVACVGVQSSPREGPQLGSADACCQTLTEACPTPRPPTHPGGRHRQQHPVNLNTKHRLLRNFKATPRRSIEDILRQSLLYVNPRGVGCCPFHIILAIASKVIKGLTEQMCETSYQPFSTWQCQSCFVMNATTAEDSDIGIVECDICGVSTGCGDALDAGLDGRGVPDVNDSREVDRESPSADGDRSASPKSELLSETACHEPIGAA